MDRFLSIISHATKIKEQVFKITFSFILISYGLYVILQTDLIFNPQHQYLHNDETTYIIFPQPHNKFFIWNYYLQSGYHLHRLIFHFMEPERKDKYAMFLHHVC